MLKNALLFTTALCAAGPLLAQNKLTTSIGMDYTSGDYGTHSKTTILSVPVAVKYETGNITLKASVPWLRVTAPTGSSLGPDGRPLGGGGANRTTESGMGDLVTSVTWAAYNNAASGVALDLTGKIKWGTADEDKGLGTGENDFSAQADIYKTIDRTTLFATLGYKVYGDPSGIDFRNVPYGGLGVSQKLSDTNSVGLTWDYRPKVISTSIHTSELTGFLIHKLSASTKAQFYVVKGLSDGSPDWGGGLVLSHSY